MNELFWYSRQLREAVSTTGMENGWNDAKCKEVFDKLIDKYLLSIEFIRGRDKSFWDGMNRSLEQAEGPDE